MGMYYARNGDEITMEQWGKLFEDMGYKRVDIKTFPSGRWVSTVWLGLDHSFGFHGDDSPLIFETMVFDGSSMMDEYMERYTTEEQAREGHQRIVQMVEALEAVESTEKGEVECPTSETK